MISDLQCRDVILLKKWFRCKRKGYVPGTPMARRFDKLLEHMATNILDRDDDLEQIAGWGLSAIIVPSEKHVESVHRLLTHGDHLLVIDAINALVSWRRKVSLSTIVRLCSGHKHELVRQAVVEAIWDLKGFRFRTVIEGMLQDRSRLVRMWAVSTCGALFPDRRAKRMLRRMSDLERFLNVRVALFWNLYSLGCRGFLDPFLALLSHRRPLIRRLVCASLCQREKKYLQRIDAKKTVESLQRRLKKEPVQSVQMELRRAVNSLSRQ